jgi:hypothetical protein
MAKEPKFRELVQRYISKAESKTSNTESKPQNNTSELATALCETGLISSNTGS